MATPTLVATTTAATTVTPPGTAGAGSRLDWYGSLEKPRWRPPPWAFGAVRPPLYVLISAAGARALDHLSGARRRAFIRSYLVDLALNASWPALFFGARAPRLALADLAALNAANLDLLRRTWHADRVAAAYLVPHLAWTGFATALNAAIARRNP